MEKVKLELVKREKRTRIRNVSSGLLFTVDSMDDLVIKSEYMTEKGLPECYLLSSGETFWGGKTDPEEVGEISVYIVDIVKTKIDGQKQRDLRRLEGW